MEAIPRYPCLGRDAPVHRFPQLGNFREGVGVVLSYSYESRGRDSFKGGRFVTPQKSGYRFLCCYSILAFLSQIFPLEFGKWPSESNQSSTSECLSYALVPVKLPSVNPEPHSYPSPKIWELEILPLWLQRSYPFLCSVASHIHPSDHPISLNPRDAKILPSHLQYFSFIINSLFCLSEELNPGKYLSISKVHENLWRYSVWIYWALIKILAIFK